MGSLVVAGEKRILGHTVRVFQGHGDEFFVLAKDVATWLEIQNVSQMLEPIDVDEKKKILLPPIQCIEGLQPNTEYWFLTENGLYEVLFLSRKPAAKEFKAGVKKLLHDLRTGKAQIPQPLSGDYLIRIGQEMNRLNQQLVIAEQKITADAPKVHFHDTVKNCNVMCHFAGLANILHNNGINIGRNRLFQDFRNTGDIKQHDALFTQKALDRKIGQNVQTGEFKHNDTMQLSFRAFLNYKGIVEVFDRHNLTQDQRDAVMKDLTAADEPLLPEAYFEEEAA